MDSLIHAVPIDPAELDHNPYPVLHRLRNESPVAWVEPARMWFVTRYDDVVEVLRDPDRFSTDASGSTIRDTFGRQMLSAEGDDQRRFKSACAGPFTARAVRDEAGPAVARITAGLIDRFAARGRAELRSELAAPLALATVAMVLGLSEEYHPAIRHWYDAFARALANFHWDETVRREGQEAVAAFRDLVEPALPNSPGLLGTLARAHPRLLSDDEIVRNSLIVLFGGIETTEAMVLNALWALLNDPPSLAAVETDRSLLPGAIEEAMRWEPAVQTCTRHATTRTVLRGSAIAAGDIVQCMLGGANRDPAVFLDPDRFDIRRVNAAEHLSFGAGRHYCLGAALARLEARVALETLMERCPLLALDPDTTAAPYGSEFRKPPALPVIWRPDA
jgi:cytochrome P450